MIKLSRRIKIWIAILILIFPGFVCIALLPSSIEGVYSPLEMSSTMGCDCDQFEEFRDGRVIFHVMEGGDSFSNASYEKDPSGTILITLPPEKPGEEGKLLARANPHLLGTTFYYPDEGKSEWAWKRFVTTKMKTHMAGAKIRGLANESGGVRFVTYDSSFKVLSSTFHPKSKSPTGPASQP